MYRNPIMTTIQARETIDRLSEQTASLRRFGVATDSWIADYNESLSAFVPRDKMPLFSIGKNRYVGDTARPGAFVQAVSSANSSRPRAQTSTPCWQKGTSNHPIGNVQHPAKPE
jgi:hypothetical protein